MANVLFVKANDRPAEQSVSVKMYEQFLKTYKENHPQDQITELALYHAELPYYGNDAITGLYKAAQGLEASAEEQQAAAIVNRYMDQFLAADKIVFAFPVWNATVPAPLITYISYLSQAGKTFKFTAEGLLVGLVDDKRVALLCARGADYSSEYKAPFEMGLNHMKNMINFWGIKSPEVVVIEGHEQYRDRSAEIIASGLSRTADLAAGF